MNEKIFKEIVWSQFGAAIDMLKNAIIECPDDLWADKSKKHEFWYMAYHTLFWLDCYLYGLIEGFKPPQPFGLEELDPAGVMPERVYSKDELLTYLEHGRRRCRVTIQAMTAQEAATKYAFGKVEMRRDELLLYNLRHVQHHTAQLNLLLRQSADFGSRWIFTAE
jgi:hypothetical protein